jgi:hypothetical protein
MKVMGAFVLAAIFDEQVRRATDGGSFSAREFLIGATVAVAVGFALVLWIYFRVRRKSDRQDQERLSRMVHGQSSGKSSRSESSDGVERRRKRRRRRDHRPRNPPLSQTGGLPPPRPDDQLPKY